MSQNRLSLRSALALTAVALFCFASPARAALSPLSVSIIPPVQFPPSSFTVLGARVSALWGEHSSVYGLDLGVLGNITDQNFGGIAIAGGFNWNKAAATVIGLQAAGLVNVNVNKTTIVGVQVAGLLNSNLAETTATGLMIAPLGNYSPHATIYGFQVGLYNRAREVYGFQFGLINVTQSLHGIQVGLLNFNDKGLFSVAPILNIGI